MPFCNALAVLDIIADEHLVANAARVGSHLSQGLLTLAERHPQIGDVRGLGFRHDADGGKIAFVLEALDVVR